LQDELALNQIVTTARELALSEHTYDRRVEKLLTRIREAGTDDWLRRHPGRNRAPDWWRWISTPRTVWQIAPRRNFAMLPDTDFARQWKARHY